MGALKGGDETLQPGDSLEGIESGFIGHGIVFDPPRIFEEGVFRAHPRVVETRRNTVRVHDLTVFILHQIAVASVEYPRLAR